ncbi:hypothetical protein FHS55_002606 [Angulomicrobium tetraedrale]|uniref:Zorya protein ZorC EH domain-containing protein n=1 Tax=Ancylobacter tetraedralis TaxID=217068 RepID=A0A839ZB92_9HYPH|nr:hypothetical protein [Ancylobacter tetraedralis]
MSSLLKDAIRDLMLRHAPTPRRPEPEAAVLRAARKLPEGAGDATRAKDYDALAVSIAQTLSRQETLTVREARDGAWCLWTTKLALAARPQTLDPFLAQLRDHNNKGASRALALSYLVSFHDDRPGLSAVAGALRDLVSVMGPPFDALHDRFRIFDAAEGPRRIGDAALIARLSPRRILEENGLRMELALAGGYVEPCTRRVLQRAAEDRRLPPAERLDFLPLIALQGDPRRLTFPTHKSLLADALLLPYRAQPPEKAIKDRTLDLLTSLDELGDPRTKSANWVGMPEAREIAISWLTEQALRQFLDVVEAVNPNPNWKYRRTFWEAMYERGLIREAWVVLDRVGANEAFRSFGHNARFARFTAGGGIQSGHAVLLLRIGRGICAEWSFNGKCRFWVDADRAGAPKLYEPQYDGDFLRSGQRYAPVEEIEHIPHTGENAWQHKAARRIASMTGARLSAREYML